MQRSVIGAAVLALAATLCTAGPATAETIGANPASGAYEEALPLSTKKAPQCKTRFATLRPGKHELTLWARRDRAKRFQKPATYGFEVTRKGKYRWSDCLVKSDDRDVAAIHMASIDQEGARGVDPVLSIERARHRIFKQSFGGNHGIGIYAYKSTLELTSAAPGTSPPQKPRNPGNKQRPGQEKPAPSTGCGALWRHDSGRNVRNCADWAPAGHKIPVLANRDQKAGRRGWIDPAGDDWYYCQNKGTTHRIGSATNDWWAYTMAENGVWGWVPETYFVGGGPNEKAAGLKHC